MAKIFIVDGAGARVQSQPVALDRFHDATREAFGNDIDLTSHTPQNQIATINAVVWSEVGEELVRAALYGASIDHAPDKFLDAFGSLLDIPREEATYSRVVGVATGVDGTVIPAGVQARTEGGDVFQTERASTISGGSVQIAFRALQLGPVPVEAHSLRRIVNPQIGWETIDNPEAGVVGKNKESDASYRANLKARTAHSSIGSIGALRSALNSAGATEVKILENTNDAEALIEGITLPAHAIFVIADGGERDDIARAIENHRGMGVGTYAALTGNYINDPRARDASNGTIAFNETEYTGLDMRTATTTSLKAGVLNAVTNVSTLALDKRIRFDQLGNRLIAFFRWKPGHPGFTEISSGNTSTAGQIVEAERPSDVYANRTGQTTTVVAAFPGRTTAQITANGLTPRLTATVADFTNNTTLGNPSVSNGIAVWTTTETTGIVGTTTNTLTFGTDSIANKVTNDLGVGLWKSPVPVRYVVFPSSPTVPYGTIATLAPNWGGAGFTIQAYTNSSATPTSWQYRYRAPTDGNNTAWTTISSTSRSITQNIASPSTRNVVQEFDIRCRNSSGAGDVYTLQLPVADLSPPRLLSCSYDGSVADFIFDRPLRHFTSTASSDRDIFDCIIDGTPKNDLVARRIVVVGRKVSVEFSTTFTASQVVSFSYTTTSLSGRSRLQSNEGIQVQSFNTVNNGTPNPVNKTNANIPGGVAGAFGVIREALSTTTGLSETTLYIVPNAHTGGQATDQYDYQLSTDNGITWSDWTTLSETLPGASPALTAYDIEAANPTNVRFRASNPNARLGDSLGLTGLSVDAPFIRSVDLPIRVTIDLDQDSSLNADAIALIKSRLIARVDAYAIGEEIWVNDLEGIAEGVAGTRIDSLGAVFKDGGASIGNHTPRAFEKWTLLEDDILVQFS